MERGNWWMLASPVQVPRKGEGDMEGLIPAWQPSQAATEVSLSKPINVCVHVCEFVIYCCCNIKRHIFLCFFVLFAHYYW